jgi:hypothetical protein
MPRPAYWHSFQYVEYAPPLPDDVMPSIVGSMPSVSADVAQETKERPPPEIGPKNNVRLISRSEGLKGPNLHGV